MGFVWDESKVEAAVGLWRDGKTGSEIAREIGAPSRNAVIGKLHRMGLSDARPQRDRPARNRPPRSFKVAPPKPKKASAKLHLIAEPLPPAAETDIARVSMDDITDRLCKWVCADFTGMAAPMYCGCSVVPGLQYCEHHARRAYRADAPAQPGGFVRRKGRMLQQLTSPSVDPRTLEDA